MEIAREFRGNKVIGIVKVLSESLDSFKTEYAAAKRETEGVKLVWFGLARV